MTNHGPDNFLLHIDDDPAFTEMTAEYLREEIDSVSITTATNSADGLERLSEQEVDCIISDFDMPGATGIEFLEDVRRDHPELPFILFTGKGSEEVASDAISAGVTDYFQKQMGREQFQLLANRILEAIKHRRSKLSYEEIFEKSPDGIVIHDADDGRFIDMNSQYIELYGYESKAEFIQAGFESIHIDEPPYTVEQAKQHVTRAIEEGPQTIEWPGVRKDGSHFWAEVHLTPVELYGEERLLAVVRDVTERREYQQKLELAQQRTEYALEATNSYIFEIDFETGNERRFGDWDSIHGIDPEEVPTTEDFIEQAVHPEDISVVREAHQEFTPQPGASVRFDYRTHPNQGNVKWVRAKLQVQSHPNNGVLRGIGLATDVTELK